MSKPSDNNNSKYNFSDKNLSTKEFVLKRLEYSKGSFITGMCLASELGVSRNAIWKAVKELKDEGYEINSVNNKGYSLDEKSDILSPVAIKWYMEEAAHFYFLNETARKTDNIINNIIDNIAIYDELESTSKTAKLECITGVSSRKIIIARSQTAGKGHNNKQFNSPEGGIYMSIILDNQGGTSPLSVNSNKRLDPSVIGNAVRSVLAELTGKRAVLDNQFNRISIGGKNVCGIMTEYFADLETDTINNYIIGIGIRKLSIPKNKAVADIILSILSNIV